MRSTPSLSSLSGSLWPGVVVPMGQIEWPGVVVPMGQIEWPGVVVPMGQIELNCVR